MISGRIIPRFMIKLGLVCKLLFFLFILSIVDLDASEIINKNYFSIPNRICQLIIEFYRNHGSKFMKSRCGFYPSCSKYGLESFRRYGALKGLLLTINRLQRCHRWSGKYYPKIFYNNRWLNYDPVE